jgi:hypothetical protein
MRRSNRQLVPLVPTGSRNHQELPELVPRFRDLTREPGTTGASRYGTTSWAPATWPTRPRTLGPLPLRQAACARNPRVSVALGTNLQRRSQPPAETRRPKGVSHAG